MQNIDQLIEKLKENYSEIEKGSRTVKVGKELTNTAGKILTALNIKLNYNSYMDKKQSIDFLEDSK